MRTIHRLFVAMLTHEVTPMWGSRLAAPVGVR